MAPSWLSSGFRKMPTISGPLIATYFPRSWRSVSRFALRCQFGNEVILPVQRRRVKVPPIENNMPNIMANGRQSRFLDHRPMLRDCHSRTTVVSRSPPFSTTYWVPLLIGVCRMTGQSINAEFAAGEDGQSLYPSSSESHLSRPLTQQSRDRFCPSFSRSTSCRNRSTRTHPESIDR